jgi:hypothetical protein
MSVPHRLRGVPEACPTSWPVGLWCRPRLDAAVTRPMGGQAITAMPVLPSGFSGSRNLAVSNPVEPQACQEKHCWWMQSCQEGVAAQGFPPAWVSRSREARQSTPSRPSRPSRQSSFFFGRYRRAGYAVRNVGCFQRLSPGSRSKTTLGRDGNQRLQIRLQKPRRQLRVGF